MSECISPGWSKPDVIPLSLAVPNNGVRPRDDDVN